ncbi:MAG TPA: class I SAM-dependent methyltransferase [Candidatus Binatia bacterium]|nr:class I SAM-dependent methyltransferase [Candidatus Binatia bacterium]
MTAWHDDDGFWQTFGPYLFGAERLASLEAQVGAIASLLRIEPGSRVLDLCCGVGRLAVELARRGCLVTGVDRTSTYLNQAREQALAAGVRVEFVRDDMRRRRADEPCRRVPGAHDGNPRRPGRGHDRH